MSKRGLEKGGRKMRNLLSGGESPGDDDRMTLRFDRCLFQKNKFAPPVDMFPTYGVVSARSPDNTLVFEDCIFRDNVYNEVRI